MRRFNALAAGPVIASALILASCETSRQVAGRTELADIPAELLREEPAPVTIRGDETFSDMLDVALQDGANLAQCRANKAALVNAIGVRDAIQGAKQ